jgi:hypothetical protein
LEACRRARALRGDEGHAQVAAAPSIWYGGGIDADARSAMSIRAVLLPLFVQVLLTFGLYFWMAYYRVSLLRKGAVDPRKVALREPNWPPHVLKVTYAAHNQLEIPMLFYVLTILAIVTHHADMAFVVLAWIFVIARIAHACVHTTSNIVPRRGPLFGLGLTVLLVMWVMFMVRILATAA